MADEEEQCCRHLYIRSLVFGSICHEDPASLLDLVQVNVKSISHGPSTSVRVNLSLGYQGMLR